ncbi:Linear gramicidin dehydrogenase LgrE [compost metagenome]
MAETYKYNHQQEPLDADISVLFGTEDMTQEQAAAWQAATNGSCSIHAFSGGHFFINEQTEQVSNLINSVLLPTNTLITGAPLF